MDGEKVKKKPMTDAERLELAAKLDKELDEFIAGLPKKKYTDGWPEDRWEEVCICTVSKCSLFIDVSV